MSTDRPMLVSVIVPAYNVQGIIGACVASVLAQTHRDLEVIAVNDRSTDDTGKILDALAEEDPRLKVLHLPVNVGLHAARVEGLKVATGTFIGFVDGDDIARPAMFASLANALVQYDADIAICGFSEINAQSREVLRSVRFKALEIHDTDLLGHFASGVFHSGVMWNKLYRRELLLPNAMIPLDRAVDSGADYIVGVGCFADARRVVVLPDVLHEYLSHPQSMSRGASNPARFALLFRCYVACLEAHQHKRIDRYRAIDSLYAWQFRFSGYQVRDRLEFGPHAEGLRSSLLRMAELYPEGVDALVHVYDDSSVISPVMPLRYSLGQVRLAFREVLRSLSNTRFS
jgi:hypothetical protein